MKKPAKKSPAKQVVVRKLEALSTPKEPPQQNQERPSPAADPEPSPTKSKYPHVWDMVVSDMHMRDRFGSHKYGTALQPFNGRDPLVDAYQEALDMCVYLRQAIYERDILRAHLAGKSLP